MAYITLNYDNLFDWALEIHGYTRAKFKRSNFNMSKYIPDDKWIYIKLHGSVDWGRRVKSEFTSQSASNDLKEILNYFDNVDDLNSILENEIVFDDLHNNFSGQRKYIFPAISVPTGESKLNYPVEHEKAFKKHLDNCENFLFIGFSGQDKHVLELLADKKDNFKKVFIVSSSEKSATSIMRLILNNEKLAKKLTSTKIDVYKGNGFDEFVNHSGLDEYLADFKKN